jgi:hypothetical protein
VREASSPEGLCAFAVDIIGTKAEIAKHPRIERSEVVALEMALVPDGQEQGGPAQRNTGTETSARLAGKRR